MFRVFDFFKALFDKRYIIYQLAKRDFVQKYVDSYFGIAWAILEPLLTTTILSVIFILGFKAGKVSGVPFFIYMLTGMVGYNYFSASVGEGTQVIRAYSFLVKKVNFQLSILPIVKNLSCSLVHFIMVGILIVALLANGYYPNWYWLQALYYYFAMNVLILGISWASSALSVFVPDLRHIVTILLQFLFYLSPIFWSSENVPTKWLFWLKLNPMHYIVTGYRNSFLYEVPFWHAMDETIYFWTIAMTFMLCGISIFRRLRPHFADVI